MRTIAAILILLYIHIDSLAQTPQGFDSLLAKKLGADAYGMKKFTLVLLKTGSVKITDKSKLDSLFSGHMKNIQRLASENKLIIAGPLGKNSNNYEGIFVFNSENMKEVQQQIDTDPAIHSGILKAELYLWYSSASLQEIPALHNQIQREHF
ncbi:MAG: hypothetical protein ABJA57_12370 [Ginsengibacter sp.]